MTNVENVIVTYPKDFKEEKKVLRSMVEKDIDLNQGLTVFGEDVEMAEIVLKVAEEKGHSEDVITFNPIKDSRSFNLLEGTAPRVTQSLVQTLNLINETAPIKSASDDSWKLIEDSVTVLKEKKKLTLEKLIVFLKNEENETIELLDTMSKDSNEVVRLKDFFDKVSDDSVITTIIDGLEVLSNDDVFKKFFNTPNLDLDMKGIIEKNKILLINLIDVKEDNVVGQIILNEFVSTLIEMDKENRNNHKLYIDESVIMKNESLSALSQQSRSFKVGIVVNSTEKEGCYDEGLMLQKEIKVSNLR